MNETSNIVVQKSLSDQVFFLGMLQLAAVLVVVVVVVVVVARYDMMIGKW